MKAISTVSKQADALGWKIQRIIYLGTASGAGFVICTGAGRDNERPFSVHSFSVHLSADFCFGRYDLTEEQAHRDFNSRVLNALES